MDASQRGDWVLIEAGTYSEEVLVTAEHEGIHIRGMDRNSVIVDGQHKTTPEGSNGIQVLKANNVSIENLTVRNFDRATANGSNGNEVWWNGGDGTGVIGAHKWLGRYLTAYDDGLLGGYGLFTSNTVKGSLEDSYASGFGDSGLYIGACRNCQARVFNVVMENNALGYSGSNSGGRLSIENSVFSHNSIGFAPNSENPGDPPPPRTARAIPVPIAARRPSSNRLTSNAARCSATTCSPKTTTSTRPETHPRRPEMGRRRRAARRLRRPGGKEHDLQQRQRRPAGLRVPQPVPAAGKHDLLRAVGQPDQQQHVQRQRLQRTRLLGRSDASGRPVHELGQQLRVGQLVAAATHPANIETTWGCQNGTTPNPENGFAAIEYLLLLQGESEARTPTPQPVPPAQPTMPNPCQEVPYNPLCQ